ncbi:MAG: VanZ family protein, partial [Treponema sp.]|nr:VanZ family protein [Treponema sp.]
LHRIVRKLFGHYGLFLATALAGMIFICMTFKGWKNKIFATLVYSVIGFVVAGGSELIQKYTPGRGPSWKDVGIDFGGFRKHLF